MQKIVVVVFAIIFLFKPALPVLEYVINYDYITKELCINKEKKSLECNGKCHLKNKLAQASETSENTPPDRKLKTSPIEILFFLPITEFQLSGFLVVSEKKRYSYSDFYTFVDVDSIFHPPSLM